MNTLKNEFLNDDQKNPLVLVAEFHKLFRHPILSDPQIPVKARSDLRLKLITEELGELKAAIEAGDLIEVADALCDLQYVLSGTILEFGMKDLFAAMFADVHQSNMSKACSTFEEANASQIAYTKEGESCHIVLDERTGKYLLYREDKKTLKSKYYKPVDLTKFF